MIRNAQIHFNDAGTPVADSFDDVYFSNDDGQAESDYVFYTQNKLNTRLLNHDRDHFVVAETGFGTGLNFLNTWAQFQRLKTQRNVQRLYFISFEKYPIKIEDLRQALKAWPDLSDQAHQLCAQYPDAVEGCHRLEFDGGEVILDLWFGDVHTSLPKLSYAPSGLVDAWYLDGFAPSKNPDMWQQSLFDAMAALSRTNATFATFTAAGFVRRGLQQAGFDCQKVKGYGRKREMVIGQFNEANPQATNPEYYRHSARKLERVAVIGGGIGSACLSYQLAKRNISTTLFCKDETLAGGASHNRQGAVYPNLQAEYSTTSELYALSFLYARRFYQHIEAAGFNYDHDWCGVLLQSVTDGKRTQHQKIASSELFPESLIRYVSVTEAQNLANIDTPFDGLFIEQAGWVSPPQLTEAVHNAAQAKCPGQQHFNADVSELDKREDGWYLLVNTQWQGPFSDVFVCGGEHSDGFSQTQHLGLHGVRGQVSHIQAGEASSELTTVLCHKGYFTPSLQGEHCMGATFEKYSKGREVTEQDNATNRAQLQGFYGDTQFDQSLGEITGAKAAVRCCFNDHFPMIGQVPDPTSLCDAFANLRRGKHHDFEPLTQPHEGLHVVTGFGARGLCSAPLVTEHLVAALCDEPRPFSERLNQALHPARFVVRDLIRNKI
ncbi:bifunctional tRNA (5-methylaminomethyl-2-thiouridine)(34)-methyltransferase MnmD/FAD-dependent 5-carboxymethylaminomethyl-2-thiouridine(34) oxidoreductase MnmC [Pseudoalteromonas rubra]|uniref:tRNA 5-methylaminomethyl-2-thiouridine biosynthesis bifunctional protein MnmC n=1 Tax=Pseudoalteromonas rubra TaxID=43658 RepID=A0A5S3WLY9_9GAMM|nr:bifunctional tRNA (5-methylaminomethyl-2-thiouridine)(34)-methyltransferase MnmD/FAD-dependent 5-carboxymethylaminomethyl-2-thiouridine(34) oxidoreductase MnmC [Pseudoalteromonas rubra]TMP28603.1 bifunctional tRNA (5-methylaminomethyl-2-thiouridine)(34)-methyltransferase MnmD/FAD-dependent 5-carboxymethylaminomethyl-2-thiouridine(34) oxidoreductase MnmC [Pseudoalteromonas rubra]TMP30534.1 bifunctional tRNA (5-methylaminomethyl-2-thiouridine)(34)-methyltransferase MnmD/FAD-dependent 5-carboxyme